jgi:LmbE family N-acetylglucosaminyl deacetylase
VNPLAFVQPGPRVVLCIGAHCDDIEIGCAATLLTLSERFPDARFHWVIFAGDAEREKESRDAAQRLLGARCAVDVQHFRGSYLPFIGAAVKDYFEVVARRVTPDVIFTHHLADRHQDHRLLAELTWNTFRNHLIFEYEIPKYEGDLGHPNVYVPLAESLAKHKVDTLMESFPTQHARSWFKHDLFMAHMRIRGIECHAPSGYAEAFHARKITL